MIPLLTNQPDLTAQNPATGISQLSDIGNSKWYRIPCRCGCGNEITAEVEVDEFDHIIVNLFTTQKTEWWDNWLLTRLRLTWRIWVHGYVEYHSYVLMDKQQALNFAETLKTAIKDVRAAEDKRNIKKALNNLRK